MAKDKELVEKEQAGALAEIPDALVGGLGIEIESSGGVTLPTLKLFQGSAEEAAQHGEHPRGCFLDTLDKTELTNPRVVILGALNSWVRWDEGSERPAYCHFDKSHVPPDDLKGDVFAADKADKPRAEYQVLTVVGVEGRDYPMIWRFKSTGLACLERTIAPLEEGRRRSKKPKGLYEFGSKDAKGQGKAYKRLTVRPVGDIPDSLKPLAVDVHAKWTTFVDRLRGAAVERDDAGEAEAPDSNIPI